MQAVSSLTPSPLPLRDRYVATVDVTCPDGGCVVDLIGGVFTPGLEAEWQSPTSVQIKVRCESIYNNFQTKCSLHLLLITLFDSYNQGEA